MFVGQRKVRLRCIWPRNVVPTNHEEEKEEKEEELLVKLSIMILMGML